MNQPNIQIAWCEPTGRCHVVTKIWRTRGHNSL